MIHDRGARTLEWRMDGETMGALRRSRISVLPSGEGP
jgi:hypothetical protein